MHKGRFIRWDVGPEFLILKLKLNNTGGLASAVSNKQPASLCITGEARWGEFTVAPHGCASLLEPARGFTQDFHDKVSLLAGRLANRARHWSRFGLAAREISTRGNRGAKLQWRTNAGALNLPKEFFPDAGPP
jgi:hypothetical protein